jgi:hypothetical protein
LEIVPEPATYVMMLVALMPMAWRLLRRFDATGSLGDVARRQPGGQSRPQITSPMP